MWPCWLSVLAEALQRRSGIVGKNIRLVRKSYTIVGVVRPRFTWAT